MRAHYLQHVSFEGPGIIADQLRDAGFALTACRLYEGDPLPDAREVDLLVVMGGPMSVNDAETHPWLLEEKRLIRECIDSDKPVLGICLGAQLIASALGTTVFSNGEKEIGWFPINRVDAPGIFQFPDRVVPLHWHGETFDLPAGATRIAESAACLNQAFQLGRHVIGLQFHLEITRPGLEALVENCREELIEGQYVQTEEELLGVDDEHLRSLQGVMRELIGYLTEPAR